MLMVRQFTNEEDMIVWWRTLGCVGFVCLKRKREGDIRGVRRGLWWDGRRKCLTSEEIRMISDYGLVRGGRIGKSSECGSFLFRGGDSGR
jgi:hypothetical protein